MITITDDSNVVISENGSLKSDYLKRLITLTVITVISNYNKRLSLLLCYDLGMPKPARGDHGRYSLAAMLSIKLAGIKWEFFSYVFWLFSLIDLLINLRIEMDPLFKCWICEYVLIDELFNFCHNRFIIIV